MSDLKPCPFCGGEAQVDRMGTSRVSMQISCEDCGADVETGETWIDGNSQWNTRASGWTPISNCPQKKGAYWCYVDDDSLVIKYWVKMFDFDYGWNDCNVTHWMPLPAPPAN